MNIKETVDRLIADFEQDRTKAAKYFWWWEAYERALTETTDSRIARSTAFAETILAGRRLQLEQFPDDPGVREELAALRVAIKHLRYE